MFLINTVPLHQARASSGISLRAHADAAGVTLGVLTRLCETADATHMTVRDLAAVAEAVGLQLADLTSHQPRPSTTVSNEVVAALLDHRQGIAIGALIAAGAVDETEDDLVRQLTDALRPVGLAVSRDRDTLVLTSRPRTQLTDHEIERTQAVFGRAAVKRSGASLMHRAHLGDLGVKILDNTKSDGFLATRSLQRAGLLAERSKGDKHLRLTERVQYSLMLA